MLKKFKLSNFAATKTKSEPELTKWEKRQKVKSIQKSLMPVAPNLMWCAHEGGVLEDIDGCGLVCSGPGKQRGVLKFSNWPRAPCKGEGSCEDAKWASCEPEP